MSEASVTFDPDEVLAPRELSEPVRQARAAIFSQGLLGARPAIDQLIAVHPYEEDLRAIQANMTLWSGDMDGAWKLASERLAQRRSAPLLAVAAGIAKYMDEPAKAASLLQESKKLDADHFLVLRQEADQADVSGEFEKALAIRRRGLALYPEDPDLYSGMLTSFMSSGNMGAQERLLAEAPAWFMGTCQYHYGQGRVALQKRDMVRAEDEFRQAVALCPSGSMYWAYLSLVLRSVARPDEAEQAARFALDLNSRNSLAMSTLANVARHRGDYKAAEEWERRGLESVPALRSKRDLRKANAQVRAKNQAAAIATLKKASQGPRSVTSMTARRMLVGQLVLAGKWSEARAELDAAKATGDQDPSLVVYEFSVLAHEGRAAEASKRLETLLAEEPIRADVFAPAIRFLHGQGEERRVNELGDKLLATLPGPPALLAAAVVALSGCGYKEKAREVHRAALRRFPEDTALRLIDAGLTAEAGNVPGAIRTIQGLPPHMRPRILPKGIFLKAKFWRALFRALLRRRKRRRRP